MNLGPRAKAIVFFITIFAVIGFVTSVFGLARIIFGTADLSPLQSQVQQLLGFVIVSGVILALGSSIIIVSDRERQRPKD